jgi:indolepyruvate ferredoxin oxidoreductase
MKSLPPLRDGACSRRKYLARVTTEYSRSGTARGVNRSGGIFRHANLDGSSKYGGLVALTGDDHVAESSSAAHAGEFSFVDAMVPTLNSAGVQEIIDYWLYGYALSRFVGTWTTIKCVKDNIESTASVNLAATTARFRTAGT